MTDLAPLGRLLCTAEVVSEVGLHRTTIWRRVRAGQFPAPLCVGKRGRRWPAAAVEKWKHTLETTPPS